LLAPWLLAMGEGTATPVPNDEAVEAAARTAARPLRCAVGEGFWRWHTLVRSSSCALLACGYSALGAHPKRALALAQRVLEHDPDDASASLLEARARVALRDFEKALSAFERAGVSEPRALADAAALHDYARALAAGGRTHQAAVAYRLLMPRSEALSDRDGARLCAAVEAALALMNDSEAGASEAVALLTPQLERSQYRGGEAVARWTLRLALDRSGSSAPAQSAGISDLESTGAAQYAYLPWLTERDRAALIGLAYADRDAEKARAAWHRFLELTPEGQPFRAHAEGWLRRFGASGS
jgi:tetratricopeptide (TPR) repeat protein